MPATEKNTSRCSVEGAHVASLARELATRRLSPPLQAGSLAYSSALNARVKSSAVPLSTVQEAAPPLLLVVVVVLVQGCALMPGKALRAGMERRALELAAATMSTTEEAREAAFRAPTASPPMLTL